MLRWTMLIFSTLMSVWLLKIFMAQKQMLEELKRQSSRLEIRSEKLTIQSQAEELYRSNMDLQVTSGRSVAQELSGKMPEMSLDIEKTDEKNMACQAKLKVIKLELDNAERAQTTSKDLIKVESERWMKTIKSLKEQLAARSPICNYVKNEPKAAKLCPPTSPKH